MNAHTPFDANQDWTNPYCQNSSNDPMVDALLGNAYHVVRTVYCNLGNLKPIYDFLNQYGMVLGVQSEDELKAMATSASYVRLYGFDNTNKRIVTDYLYVDGDRTGVLPDDPSATGSWVKVATSPSGGGGGDDDIGKATPPYIPYAYNNGSALGGETTIPVPVGTVGVPMIVVEGYTKLVGYGFTYDAATLTVTLTQPLEPGDEVHLFLTGTPAVPNNPNVTDWIQINWLYNGGYASGGEQVIAIPYTFESVPAIYKNGDRYYAGLASKSYTVDAANQRILLTEPLVTNDRLIVTIGGESTTLIMSDRTIQEVARSANVKDSEVILSTNSTQYLNGMEVVYDVVAQKIYGLPTLPANSYINSVSNGQLTYSPGNITVSLVPYPNSADKLRKDLASSSGATLIGYNSKTVAEQLDAILSSTKGVFYVDSFGAKGDSNGTVGNGTDDTPAIYACFQAAIAAGGGKIVFTPGKTYRTTYTVIYGSNTVIDMQNATIFFDVKPNDGSVFMPDSFQSYTNFTTDVIFMNGQINGRTGAGNGIGANRARRITLFNIGSKYLHWHLFDGAGAQQVKIINCWCEGTNSTPFQADNAAYNMAAWGIDASGTVLPISFDATGTGGWANCRDMLVMGCTVRNARYSCVHIHNTNNQNIQVVNCHFEDSAAGVFADNNPAFVTINTLIQGCTFIRCTNPISWSGGFNVLRILDNNFYGENNTTWYYGIRILLTAAGTMKTLAIKGNTFTGLYRPIYVNGAFGFVVNDNLFQTCGGTVAPATGGVVSQENPLAILRLAGCKSGTVANNLFQDCNDPVCISIARDEVDTAYSVSVEILNNISRGSGCLLSLYYADRCTVRGNKYVGLATDFYGIYAANSCVALVLEGTYITQGTGRGIYLDGGARHVVRDNILFSAGTDYAIWLGNCTSPKTSDNIITGGYNAVHVTIGGTTTRAVLDESFATTGKQDTAAGVKVTYTTEAL